MYSDCRGVGMGGGRVAGDGWSITRIVPSLYREYVNFVNKR